MTGDKKGDAVLLTIYSLNGERCTSSSRALVHRPIYDTFTVAVVYDTHKVPKIGSRQQRG